VDLQRLVPFGNKCALALKPTSNGHAAHRTGRIIGYLVDTPGYIALLEPFPDKPFRPPRIVASMDVVPLPVRRPWAVGGKNKFNPSRKKNGPHGQ
jgi:hypothetical protein